MAYIKRKLCSKSGCNNIAVQGSAYCEEHQPEVSRGTTSKYQKFYATGFWKRARSNFLMTHIWCEECLKQGKHTLSNVVHHGIGFNSWESFCDKRYWVALCDSCHSKIHISITNEELYNKNKDKW